MIKIHKIKESQGAALLTVVLIFLVLLIMLSGVMAISIGNQRNSFKVNSHTSAFYAAESALNVNLAKIENYFLQLAVTNQDWDSIHETMTNFLLTQGGSHSMSDNMGNSVETQTVISAPYSKLSHPDYLFITITVIGDVGGMQRVVEKEVGYYYKQGLQGNQQIGKAIIANASITLGNGSEVTGRLGSNMIGSSQIVVGNTAGLITKILIPEGVAPTRVSPESLRSKIEVTPPYEFPPINFPTYPALNTLQDVTLDTTNRTITLQPIGGSIVGSKISSMNLSANTTIDLGSWVDPNTETNKNNVKILRVTGSFSMSGITLDVVGEGRLLLMLEYHNPVTLAVNTISIGNGSTISSSTHPEDKNKILVNLKTTNISGTTNVQRVLQPGNNSVIYANLLADNVVFLMSNVTLGGHLITNALQTSTLENRTGYYAIDLGSGTIINVPGMDDSMLVYAPNSNIKFWSGFHLYGAVVGNEVLLGGNADISYRDIDGADFPFDIDLPYTEIGGASPAEYSILEGATREK